MRRLSAVLIGAGRVPQVYGPSCCAVMLRMVHIADRLLRQGSSVEDRRKEPEPPLPGCNSEEGPHVLL